MCGIIGYTGWRPAGPILIECLRRLEYRGYDTAGIALFDGRQEPRRPGFSAPLGERRERREQLLADAPGWIFRLPRHDLRELFVGECGVHFLF